MSGLVVGLAKVAIGVTKTALSFSQAAKEKRGMQEANKAAAKAMLEARSKLDVNEFDAFDINKEVYELERERMLTLGASALQQGVEGSARGAAATVGGVMLANNQAGAKTRTAMNQDVIDAEKLSAVQAAKNRQMSMGLDLAEVQGAQKAAAVAEGRRNTAITQGFEGIQDTVQAGISEDMIPLYSKKKDDLVDLVDLGGQVGGQVGGQAANPFSQNPFNPYSIPQGSPNLYTPQTLGFVDPNYSFGGTQLYKQY
jgi:hypothetical protein